MTHKPKRLALFASGTGSNAAKIIDHFSSNENIDVALLVTNNSNSGVVAMSEKFSIPCLMITNEDIARDSDLTQTLADDQIDFIILAGFLRKVPDRVIEKYRNKVLNIHPSLLPKHGGLGMYGSKVHRSVKESGDNITGITIHLVDEIYDNGKIIFQKELPLSGNETVEEIEAAVRKLELENFANVIEDYVMSFYVVKNN